MRTIAHISDLHFGRVDAALLDPLVASMEALRPDVIAISGDLTQRARRSQFRAARRFLDRLHFPQVVVPGNHDVPLYNVVARFTRPLAGFRRHISEEEAPFYVDDEVAVLGINTARSLTWKAGRINGAQVVMARERLCALPEHVVKVIVTHHPFDVGHAAHEDQVVGRAGMAIDALAACGVDVLLSGHLHAARVGNTDRYCIAGHSALVVQSGTTLSERTREETNSFNVVCTEPDFIRIEHHLWERARGGFVVSSSTGFRRTGGVWRKAEGARTSPTIGRRPA